MDQVKTVQILFLADWVRNDIDECKVLEETDTHYLLQRARPQPVNRVSKEGGFRGYQSVHPTFNDALAWIKERRVENVIKMQEKTDLAKKKLHDVVKYYPLREKAVSRV